MYVIVMKSRTTNETFAVVKNLSGEPCRFSDYAMAERAAHEKNLNIKNDEFVWVVKEDDGVYFKVNNEN